VFNRNQVVSTLKSLTLKLKSFKKISKNGLVIFADHQQIEVNEPSYPVSRSVYLCDNEFHREYLTSIENTSEIGQILVISGNGYGLYSVKSENNNYYCSVIDKSKVKLPNNHSKGGQSALRFDRLADEARKNYLRKISEYLNSVDSDLPLVIAGPAQLKKELVKSHILHKNVSDRICQVVTVRGEFKTGAEEALPYCRDTIQQKFIDSSDQIIYDFYQSLSQNPDLWVFGADIQKRYDECFVEYVIAHPSIHTDLGTVKWIGDSTELGSQFLREYQGLVGKLYYPITWEY